MKNIKKKGILIPFVLIILIAGIFFNYKHSLNSKKIIQYKQFLEEIDKGNVTDVYISNSENIKIILKNNKIYYTQNPRTDTFKESLLLKGINVHEGDSSGLSQIIPLSLFSFLMISATLYFISSRGKNVSGAFKLSSIDAEPEKTTNITFNDIAGNEEAKESIKELVDFIKHPEKYSKYNARMPRGVILYGPPGTGKTLIAKALAGEANVPFFAVNGSDFVQIYVGVGAGRIRDLFKKARDKGKAVIFIDEIDAIGKKRDARGDGGSDERDQTLNALLAEMSGFKDSQGIIVMAATNRLDTLDEALLRPGRFDRHIEVGLPDVTARYKILKLHSKNKPLAEDVDLYSVAQMTVYFSGAKLENLMNEASILAAKESSDYITMEHIDKAFGIVIAGAEKKDRSFLKDEDKKITAYHEAGHALISKLVCPENIVKRVTIIPSTKGAGGYTLNISPDRIYQTKGSLLNNIKIALGGRAAEEIIFGKENITTGAYKDLENATNTLILMAKYYGMFNNTGLLNYDLLEREGVNNSQEILKICRETISNLYNEVIDILNKNKEKLDKIAFELLEKETIDSYDIERIVAA
ncbi:ATP-dependent zinc metalloprotease FtsH [Caloramator sp. E03]|uniref:ATP-dependent metallopeptidase FtsH/Yme1/Tma family protein n=1 Tax=Caloramator sp. E03 TaxID=2576307 RepID=UPI00111034FD|nr:FtsH/Yme1/Tma family ATP-dependent metallopeptidase [Caloramator sp. E03]QCX32525.1 ATP-dependent zinc metalloprotease FtsH [Caloramator sp. E03]